jgi:hypothetical protein
MDENQVDGEKREGARPTSSSPKVRAINMRLRSLAWLSAICLTPYPKYLLVEEVADDR